MNAVACVIRNRVIKHNSTYYQQVIKQWAFSSITAKNDPQLGLFPQLTDPAWIQAQLIAGNAIDGGVGDITNGATLYYDDSIQFPKTWNRAAVVPLGKIGRLNLFREIGLQGGEG